MATVATLRDAIQVRLATVSGIKSYDVATGGGERMPCAIVYPAAIERQTAGGTYTYSFMIEAWAPLSGGLRQAQDILDALIDPEASGGIEAALYGDKTLGGIADDIDVSGFQGYGFGSFNAEPGAANALTVRIPVEVWVT